MPLAEVNMKDVLDLQLGYTDAENYKRVENKELLNKIFIRNEHLDRLCSPSISFLVGEKGTGKTAYSVFLANNEYKNTFASIRFIRETEYQKFLQLKAEKQLNLSDYTSIWKTIIYLLISQQVKEREGGPEFFQRFTNFSDLQKAIDEYYHRAFAPEIVQAIQFVQESKISADLIAKFARLGGSESEKISFAESRFQSNLFYIERAFENALKQLRLKSNHILFIDGIDIRPATISYDDYLECIRGLANAVWAVNNDLFPSIKGSNARLRVVLLVRPDIFASLGLQNLNTKIRDNSVFLDWRTEYSNSRTSGLFQVSDRLLASQQSVQPQHGSAWDHYFPWNAPSDFEKFRDQSSFVSFLRFSYYRPRDIITMMQVLQDIARENGTNKNAFTAEDFDDARFRKQYASYLLGEIKEQLTFYYGESEYETFLKFFEFLQGKARFEYSEFTKAFGRFQEYMREAEIEPPPFLNNGAKFLQFLYDLNIICYIEYPENDKPYFRWCFRERSYATISPKVKTDCTYEIFYGLQKAVNVGQKIRLKKAPLSK
jgi:hypothetical protein